MANIWADSFSQEYGAMGRTGAGNFLGGSDLDYQITGAKDMASALAPQVNKIPSYALPTEKKSGFNWEKLADNLNTFSAYTSAFAGLGGTLIGAKAANQAGKAQQAHYNSLADITEFNAKMAQKAAEEENEYIIKQSAWQQEQVDRNMRQTLGQQAAAAAYSGIGLDSVTFQEITKQTVRTGIEDEAMIRFNAELSAYQNSKKARLDKIAADSQAAMYRLSGEQAAIQGRMNMYQSLTQASAQFGNIVNSLWGDK